MRRIKDSKLAQTDCKQNELLVEILQSIQMELNIVPKRDCKGSEDYWPWPFFIFLALKAWKPSFPKIN